MAKHQDRLFREGMPVPQDIDGGSAPPPKPKPAPKPAPPASAPKPKPKPAPKPTPEDQMPIEARELMRQKAKDAAYKESEKERNLGNMFAKGGRVTRGDGCVKRGHTKGRNV